MRSRLLAIVAVISVFLILLANPPRAYACSCTRPTVKDTLASSDAVFTGKVVSVRNERRPHVDGGSFAEHIYAIEVSESWKGVTTSRVEATHTSDYVTAEGLQVFSSCELHGLVVGGTYLIYSGRNQATGELQAFTHYCNRTALLNDAEGDLKELGPSSAVGVQPLAPKTGEAAQYWWLVGAGLGILGAGLIIVRRTRHKAT
jgi:LPXTG-motif cell wall-anchored protein